MCKRIGTTILVAILLFVLGLIFFGPKDEKAQKKSVKAIASEVSSSSIVTVPTTMVVPTTQAEIVVEVSTTTVFVEPTTTTVSTTTLAPVTAPYNPPEQSGVKSSQANDSDYLACVKMREGGGNYSINTGNGYYGTYQFLKSTWDNTARYVGREDLTYIYPHEASPEDQDMMAQALVSWQGRNSASFGSYCSR